MPTPSEAVFLAIDPALHTSGAAILAPDYGGMDADQQHAFNGDYTLYEFGKVVSQSERNRYVETLIELSEELSLPAVVIAETWDGPRDRKIRLPGGELAFARDPKWTYTTILGIGEGWGRWSAEIEAANEFLDGEGRASILVERVLPNDWRDALFGLQRAKDTETLKATACRYFEGVFGYAASDDIAEAGCIGLYGITAPAIADKVMALNAQRAAVKKPKRRRKTA
jgi:hypothetical protein